MSGYSYSVLTYNKINKSLKKTKQNKKPEWVFQAGGQTSSVTGIRNQPGLQSEFQDSQGYTEKLCLEKQK